MMNEMNNLGEFLKRNSTKRKIGRKGLGNIHNIFPFSERFSSFLHGIIPIATNPDKTQSKAKLKQQFANTTDKTSNIIDKRGPKKTTIKKRIGGVKNG